MKVLLVGAGSMAGHYGRVLQESAISFEIVGRGPGSATALEKDLGIEVRQGGVTSHTSWIRERGFDAAIVCVNIEVLADVTVQLLECGVPRILVEKPAGLDLEEIERVHRVAARMDDAEVRVAYNRRFFESVLEAERMIREDGGLTSFHFEFTELSGRVLSIERPAEVLHNWLLGNSSHVIDLAFFLSGRPRDWSCLVKGGLDWHPGGATFVGSGDVDSGALFSFIADWQSAGRWSVDLRTSERRILLCPMESLQVQVRDSFAIEEVGLSDDLDQRFKPGLYRMTRAFLDESEEIARLPTIEEQVSFVGEVLGSLRVGGPELR